MLSRSSSGLSLGLGFLGSLPDFEGLGRFETAIGLFLLADLSKDMEEDEEHPCPGFYAPVDKEGANLIVTVNSKEPFGEPDDLIQMLRMLTGAR